jgi:hypothetical protein
LQIKRAVLPLVQYGNTRLLRIGFRRLNAISPEAAGEGNDRRELGLRVTELMLSEIEMGSDASDLSCDNSSGGNAGNDFHLRKRLGHRRLPRTMPSCSG